MIADPWREWVERLPVDGPGMRLVDPGPVPASSVCVARDRALASIGYQVVRASDACGPEARRRLLHRHVCLCLASPLDAAARAWVRDLAMTSPRAHLVLATWPDAHVVRERAARWDVPAVRRDRRAARAGRLLTAGRVTAARAWLRAALAAARRRADADGGARLLTACRDWTDRHGTGRDRGELARLAHEALRWITAGGPRAEVVAIAAQLVAEQGEVDTAWAWLAGVEVEYALEGWPLPPSILAARVRVALWRGCGSEVSRGLAQLPPDAQAVLAQDAAWWRDGGGRQTGPPLPAGSTLARLVQGALDGRREAVEQAEALGAFGVSRLVLTRRRSEMAMWGGVAALLDEINEAEDEAVALRRGVDWVRAQTGTTRVSVVAAVGEEVLVSSPESARVFATDLRVPIRQAGGVIGWVVADRRARDEDELSGCLRAFASACAPAVRATLDTRLSAVDATCIPDLIGRSPAMETLRRAIGRAAVTTFPVLIEGESGVGKELVARALHRLGARRDRPMAVLNCAALTDELFESELFGHVRGAFTGAVGPRTGLFEVADRGTLFLDEVAELSPRAQAKLLRALQEGEVRRVGENTSRKVDVRILAATNQPLTAAAAAGRFRKDLIFRLAVVRLQVPPLRDRLEDVPELAVAFWSRACRHRETRAWLAPDALAALARHRWPGNVRELQNVIAALVVAAPARGRVGARLVAEVLDQGLDHVPVEPLGAARRRCERQAVVAALMRHAGGRTAAARDLGVSRQGLAKLMARLGVEAEAVASGTDLR